MAVVVDTVTGDSCTLYIVLAADDRVMMCCAGEKSVLSCAMKGEVAEDRVELRCAMLCCSAENTHAVMCYSNCAGQCRGSVWLPIMAGPTSHESHEETENPAGGPGVQACT